MLPRTLSREARKVGLAAFAGVSAAAALGLGAAAREPDQGRPGRGGAVEIQILGVNDFHGHLDPPRSIPREAGGPDVRVGGSAALDAHLDRAEASHPGRTIRVHAGDMAGASPLLSSHFHDEPTMRAANMMDFDVGTLGNHEFDEGGDELLRLLQGGRRADGNEDKLDASGRPVNTSAPDYEGSTYPWIAANTLDREGRLRLPPTKVVERAGVRIGFIGVTTEHTGDFLLSSHGRRFAWLDISDVVNREAAELQAEGVEAIVVLAHSGAFHSTGDSALARGEIIDETREMAGAVDLVIAGHSHSRLNARVPNREGIGDKLVVESLAYGTAFDRVRITVDPQTGHVLGKSAETPRTWTDEVTPDADQLRLREGYRRRLGGLGDRVLGHAEVPLQRSPPGASSPTLAAVAARAQRRLARADFAFVDGGNMRADLDAGPITYADLFEVHAYEHPVMRMTLTGAEVREALAGNLHVAGLRAGAAIEPARRYVVAANRLLVDRGEADVFRRGGRPMRAVGTDLEALVAEVERKGTLRQLSP